MTQLCIHDLAEVTGGCLSLGVMPPLGGDCEPIRRVVTDSREVGPGDVFWALPGRQHHGDRYAEHAWMRAALGVVVEGRSVEPWAGKFAIQVSDSRQALRRLATWARCRFRGSVIAVHGGDAHGSASAMIRQVLDTRRQGSVHFVGASETDTSLAMLEWEEDDDYAILETSGDHGQEIVNISHLCHPHIIVITCTQHSCSQPSNNLEAVASIPNRLLETLPSDGVAILDADDPRLRQAAKFCPARIVWIGQESHCDVVVKSTQADRGKLSLVVQGQTFTMPARHPSNMKSMMASAVGQVLGVPISDALRALCQTATARQPSAA